jgi:hypothetical protein
MKKILFTAGLLVALWIVFIIGVRIFFGWDRTTNETENWPKYYETMVKSSITLPTELDLIKAAHTEAAIMGQHFRVEFRLPRTKDPKQWIDQIQTGSHVKATWRRSDHLIDCRADGDLWRVEYSPARDIYVAEAGWD